MSVAQVVKVAADLLVSLLCHIVYLDLASQEKEDTIALVALDVLVILVTADSIWKCVDQRASLDAATLSIILALIPPSTVLTWHGNGHRYVNLVHSNEVVVSVAFLACMAALSWHFVCLVRPQYGGTWWSILSSVVLVVVCFGDVLLRVALCD